MSKIIQKSKREYCFLLILLIISYSIFAFNLQGQAWHPDEKIVIRGGIFFLGLLTTGDLMHACLNGLGFCEIDMIPKNWEWPSHSSFIRHFFTGLSVYFFDQVYDGPKIDNESPERFVQGRLFAPVFGSFTVLFLYLLGKHLFNRQVGSFFAIILLFHITWMWNSRVTMSEVYAGFFIFATIFFLIYSLKSESIKLKYFILSAIFFGLGINAKFSIIQLAFLIIIYIIFKTMITKKFNYGFKKKISKNVFLVLIFTLTAMSVMFVSNPYFYPDPFGQFTELIETGSKYTFVTSPSLENDNIFRFFATFHTLLIPYFVDYYPFYYEDMARYHLNWETPQTYSSIPVTIFFFVGIFYLINSIKKKNFSHSEFMMILWFSITFIFAVLTIKYFMLDRFYLSVMFPIMLISGYGLWMLIKNIANKKLKFTFLGFFFYCHVITTLALWQIMYNSTLKEMASFPNSDLSLQSALNEPIVVISSIGFIVFFVFMVILKIKNKQVFKKSVNSYPRNI